MANSAFPIPTNPGGVNSVTGTTNQIVSTGGVDPILSLSSTLVAPGKVTIGAGNSLQLNNVANTFATLFSATAQVSNAAYVLPPALPAVSGSVLSCTTSGTMSWAVSIINIQVFTASTTYTPTPGMKYCVIEVVGGGGGGGGAAGGATGASAAGGGGSGAYARGALTAVAIGASQVVTIGAGGTGGAIGANTGNNGGTTSVGSLVSAGGGGGGLGCINAAGINFAGPGVGGTPLTGQLLVPGRYGSIGISFGTISNFGISGIGASSVYGAGGPSAVSATGANAIGYGSGGSGAAGAVSGFAGGNGSPGVVVITEYI